ncbi:PEP-CTERM sorting domain-containing protein [Paraglaciecola chathamensis]|uniref:PEP-CTERM sorting domain-containing protein n=1 Tax=Paraglaciecola chathamensis TaxID=368405 RepID=UPI0027027DFD|nr:PEP-CTERM sorting domain-containing protein [Paraglaciecola chathamensis]MDO6557899.1 PEP-CTERM sorting domain-containing protein [Paraglaciecola chathamensis]
MTRLFKKAKFISAAALLALTASQNISAAAISFGGQTATDNSGKTSNNVNSDNTINAISDGFFVETFDAATAIPGIPSANDTSYNVAGTSEGCAINSPLVVQPSSTDVLNVRTGSTRNVAAAPAGDNTCYAYTTPETVGQDSFVDIDYTNFLASIGNIEASLAGSSIDYLGFYWGSIDTYNTFEFYSGATLVERITGGEILDLLDGEEGDRESDKSNVYVNINFTVDDAFNRLRVISSGVAGEFDNIVVGLSNRNVPAPASLAFLGLGIMGMVIRKKLKK